MPLEEYVDRFLLRANIKINVQLSGDELSPEFSSILTNL